MVVITIVSVSIIAGSTITAISVGAFCSVLLFVYQWHQVGCIKYVSSGLMWRSSIDRPELHVEWLEQHGDSIQILQLQGFIFFGNSQMVYVYVLSSIYNCMISNPSLHACSTTFVQMSEMKVEPNFIYIIIIIIIIQNTHTDHTHMLDLQSSEDHVTRRP
jgi:MFS superfamily sulfate permease-like transporter